MPLTRREFLKWISAGAGASALPACQTADSIGEARAGAARVVVVGGGYGGATAAKYVKMWAPEIDVVLIERDAHFISCPLSNLVLAGNTTMEEITMGRETLRARGVRMVRDEAVAIDAQKRHVRLARGASVPYDRLIVSPGVDFMFDRLPGWRAAEAQQRVLHAWKAGEQTIALRKQLQDMRDGGVYVLHIPLAPYRCPPGPYERVCQVADYFKRAKPKSKILVLDANPDITSKAGLFRAEWNGPYKGLIEYRPNSELEDVDGTGRALKLTFDTVKGDVLNVVPPHRAGDIARQAGLITANERWCGIDWMTTESVAVKGIHVLGDSTLSAPAMPKSASMANQHGKVCAAAVIAMIRNQPVNANPVMMNTCYSFVSGKAAMHVTSIHQYSEKEKTLIAAKPSVGVSDKSSEIEGVYAWGWARNIWADSLA
jgi:NADPH-dependent 2,4-dienoyl-CoA reductase/sulfur reductase-like enzyme